jgi:DNA-binding response OmpR family regulator
MNADMHKILIIDDNVEFRQVLLVRISNLFPDVDIAEYDLVTEGWPPPESDCIKYDVLILDHDLGKGVNGLNWFKSCNKEKNFPATVILTALGNERTAMHALNSGAHYYLSKQQLTEEKLYKAIIKAREVRDNRLKIVSECQ